ncbi:TetR/AcrR family transcriptional regulator [Paenibacillus lutrae]|uniref:TetR family transcriptional regulator n=1 Tax=Paenibacillus lutrae TaxID=2078573 RepID=A0A7X3K032_9BACL|nr:TetR/AcrR family transcriptional regulator [Paenibacillus lutrae]MVP00652.1 TetR family transcriptional regulator [Paenibacillus lutrae]
MATKPSSYENIVNTAARLFIVQGYHATGLNQIISESGSPKGSLYYYFPNGKEELALECIKRANLFVQDQLRDSFAPIADPVLAVQSLLRRLAEEAADCKYKEPMPIGYWASAETAAVSEALRMASQTAFEDWQNIYAEKLLAAGFNKSKAAELGLLLVSMIEGAMLLMITLRDNKPLLTLSAHIPVLLRKE